MIRKWKAERKCEIQNYVPATMTDMREHVAAGHISARFQGGKFTNTTVSIYINMYFVQLFAQ